MAKEASTLSERCAESCCHATSSWPIEVERRRILEGDTGAYGKDRPHSIFAIAQRVLQGVAWFSITQKKCDITINDMI